MDIFGNLVNPVNSSQISVTNDDIVIFDGTSGRIIKDSGVNISSIGPGGPFLPLSGGTMTGNINLNTNDITNVTTVNGISDIYIGPGTPATDSYVILNPSNSNGINNSIIIGDNSLTNLRNLSAVADLGTAGAPWQSIFLSGNVSGVSYSRSVDNILSLPGTQTTGNLLKSNLFQKVVEDSGIAAADVVTSSSVSSIDGNIAVFDSTSGKIIKDSGLGSNIILNLAAATTSFANQNQGVSPAGARDLWQTIVGGFNGAVLNYYEDINTMYSSDYTLAGALTRRSLDGGLTWTPVIYDVPTTSTCNIIVGCNDARTLWVGITQGVGDNFYTSIDGLNFIKGPNAQSGVIYSDNIIFDSVSGLFIAGMLIDSTHSIITSPDGITWTPRVSPDYSAQINYMQLAKKNDNSVIVVVGDAQVQPSYSLDHGITWISGSGSAASAQAITWSEDKQEFIAGGVTTNLSRSSDGIVWEDRGANGPFSCTSFKWVPFPISRYYAARRNVGTGHYSLYSTPDSYLPFLQPENLEGSTILNQAYGSIVYIPQYDRFVLGVDTDGIAYSTARPLIIKPMVVRNASENLNMGGFEIENVSAIRTSTDVVNIGLTNTTSGSGSVSVGASNTAGGSTGGKSIIYGNNNNTSGSANGQCIIYGNDNTDSNSAGGTFIYGFGNTNGTGQRNILIGRNNAVPNGINEAFAMGFSVTNSISNSLVVGGTSHANIRAGSNNLCNLGVLSTNQFNTAFVNNIDTSGALAIAQTSATSVAIGRSTINTSILGKGYVNTVRPIMSGGFSMITNTTVQNTLTETTIIGAGVGSLTGVANTASAGNTSHLTASGTVNIAGTPSITIRVYGGPTSAILLSSFPIALSSIVANVPWKLNTDFVIKSIGAAGVASIQLNSTFQIADVSPNSYGGQSINNTTFDTTINNIINITAQWSSASASNVFVTNQLFTNSIYVV